MKKTSWFAVVVAVLVAATYYFEFYQSGKEEEKKSVQAKIVSLAVDQINQIQIENAKGQVLLKRDIQGWNLEEPLKDWADNGLVEDMVNALSVDKSLDTAAEGDSIDWSVYGLNKDFNKITLTDQQNKTETFQVSNKKNFEGNSFVRRGTENKVLVASNQWMTWTGKPPTEFRDHHIFRGKIGSIEKIQIQSTKDKVALVLKENRWETEKLAGPKIDQNKVREILKNFSDAKAVDFITTKPAAESLAHIELQLKDKNWVGDILRSKDKIFYVTVKDPAAILKVDPKDVMPLVDANLLDLRDRLEAFDFANLMVHEIEVTTPLKKTVITHDKDQWTVDGKSEKLDENKVRGFITRLSETRITEYLENPPAFKHQTAENRIVLRDDKKNVIFEVGWGPHLKKKSKELILAQTSLYKDTIGLDPAVIDAWGLMSLLSLEQNNKKKDSK